MPDATVKTPTGDMDVAIFEPPAKPKTAVIVVQEAFGLNGHIRNVAERVSQAGHYAIAPDLYHRHEDSLADYDDLEKALGLMVTLDDGDILDDVEATIAHLEGEGFSREAIGIVGFCMGGRIVFLTALNKNIGAGVSFYGGGIVTENINGTEALTPKATNLKAPWLGFFGDMDSMIPTEGVEELQAALEGTEHQIIRYADADHGFHCDERESFDEAASADAWQKTLDWFASNFK